MHVRSKANRTLTTRAAAWLVTAVAGAALAACTHFRSTVEPADPTLLVLLDARHPSAGTEVWKNQGALAGDFRRIGTPKRSSVGGVPTVEFNGRTDVYRGPVTDARLEGASPRTIEVWAFNPTAEPEEETLVAWGQRGDTLINMAFNWGTSDAFGALTAYNNDMGWGEMPAVGQWHHLVLTYDGQFVRVYDNGVEVNSKVYAGSESLATMPGCHINIGAQNDASDQAEPIFASEFIESQLGFSGHIALVRIYARTLTPEEVKAHYNREAARFGLKKLD